MRTSLFLMCYFIAFIPTLLLAQNAVPTAGGNATGSGGSVSYTVGQVVYTTNTGENGSVTQGVQQSYTISVESGIETEFNISLKCNAYPNPTSDFLVLELESELKSNFEARLYDINGRLLSSKKVDKQMTTISMVDYVSGIYLLKVAQVNSPSSSVIKIFKIVKK